MSGQLAAPEGAFERLSVGDRFACALSKDDRRVVCWGFGYEEAAEPPDDSFREVSAGAIACALRDDGTLKCWDGGYQEVLTPQTEVKQDSSEWHNVCAIMPDDTSATSTAWSLT